MSLLAFSRQFRSLRVSRSLVRDVIPCEGDCNEISERLVSVRYVFDAQACTSTLSWQTLIIYAINAGVFIKHVRLGGVANNTASRVAHNDTRLGVPRLT